jgi:hypothetical protein
LTQSLRIRDYFISEPADVELYMLCSDEIAAAVRKLEHTDWVALGLTSDHNEFSKFTREYCNLEAKIVKAFKRQFEFEVRDFDVNSDSLPCDARSRLESFRAYFIEDLPSDFLMILEAYEADRDDNEARDKTLTGD